MIAVYLSKKPHITSFRKRKGRDTERPSKDVTHLSPCIWGSSLTKFKNSKIHWKQGSIKKNIKKKRERGRQTNIGDLVNLS